MKMRGIIVLFALIHIATTYVVREGGVEVGRWDEEDGKTGEVIINEKKKASPAVNKSDFLGGINSWVKKISNPEPPATYGWSYGLAGHDLVMRTQKETKRPVVLYFYADWCPYCKKFDAEVLNSPEVNEFLSHTPKVKINPETEPELGAKYGISGFPIFIVKSSSGSGTQINSDLTPSQFIQDCKKAGLANF